MSDRTEFYENLVAYVTLMQQGVEMFKHVNLQLQRADLTEWDRRQLEFAQAELMADAELMEEIQRQAAAGVYRVV